ncbi:MAG: DMT family transporter [Anaerolineae bacterium]
MPIGELSALGAALTWALTGVLLTNINRKVHILAIGSVRALSASSFFLILLFAGGRWNELRHMDVETLARIVASVIVTLGAGDTSFFIATKRIGVARAMPLSMIYPLFTGLMAAFFLGECIAWPTILGGVLVLAGVYMLSLRWPLRLLSPNKDDLVGVLAALAAAVLWSAGSVVLTPASHRISAVPAHFLRQTLSAIMFLSVMPQPAGFRQLEKLTLREWLQLIAGGLSGSGIGSILYFWGLRDAGATITAVLMAASPLFSTPMSVAFLGERVNRRVVIGTLFIIAGVWCVILG